MYQGLSTDQAPPISVPFRFFLTAPFFAILIAITFFIYPQEAIFDRYSPIAVGVVHLFTLGILTMIIFGALQQMLPVLSGAVIKKRILFANIVHTNLTIGALSLSGGFIFSSSLLKSIGSITLTLAFGVFFFVVTKLLFQVKYVNSTVTAMRIFSIVGIITVLLGLHLIGSHLSGNFSSLHFDIVNIHIAFGIFGFALIIVMGVAFQVIPMFYVARDFPKDVQNKFPRVIFGMLILFGIFTFMKLEKDTVLNVLSILAIIFSYYGIVSLNNRRRPVFDITLWYWKLSLVSLIVGLVMFLIDMPISTVSIVIAFGFLYSLLQGMIYKIIPFLAWFHLSSKGYFDIPTLRGFIKEFDIKIQFYLYVSSVVFMILATVFNKLFLYIAGGLFIVSNILLLVNMITATLSYKKIANTDPMAAFK